MAQMKREYEAWKAEQSQAEEENESKKKQLDEQSIKLEEPSKKFERLQRRKQEQHQQQLRQQPQEELTLTDASIQNQTVAVHTAASISASSSMEIMGHQAITNLELNVDSISTKEQSLHARTEQG